MKNIFLGAALLMGTLGLSAQTSGADVNSVKWTGKKVTGEHYGYIQVKSADIKHKAGVISAATVVIDMNSITCTDLADAEYNGKLVGHLKSDDFFGVDKFPESRLEVKSVKKVSDNSYEVKSHLTIKGQTHPNTFVVKVEQKEKNFVLSGKVLVDRTLYHIRYGSGKFFDNLGDRMIDDNFELDFVLQVK